MGWVGGGMEGGGELVLYNGDALLPGWGGGCLNLPYRNRVAIKNKNTNANPKMGRCHGQASITHPLTSTNLDNYPVQTTDRSLAPETAQMTYVPSIISVGSDERGAIHARL
ncbi:hypothetical protein BaRGS_00034136 [Batillaria attramentaria]|uniref:Uncharacterized protein n=1 Tax=Batillaria attramentaria TaxID=370345 RepID=A0ABD0JHX7_9CAEN